MRMISFSALFTITIFKKSCYFRPRLFPHLFNFIHKYLVFMRLPKILLFSLLNFFLGFKSIFFIWMNLWNIENMNWIFLILVCRLFWRLWYLRKLFWLFDWKIIFFYNHFHHLIFLDFILLHLINIILLIDLT